HRAAWRYRSRRTPGGLRRAPQTHGSGLRIRSLGQRRRAIRCHGTLASLAATRAVGNRRCTFSAVSVDRRPAPRGPKNQGDPRKRSLSLRDEWVFTPGSRPCHPFQLARLFERRSALSAGWVAWSSNAVVTRAE